MTPDKPDNATSPIICECNPNVSFIFPSNEEFSKILPNAATTCEISAAKTLYVLEIPDNGKLRDNNTVNSVILVTNEFNEIEFFAEDAILEIVLIVLNNNRSTLLEASNNTVLIMDPTNVNILFSSATNWLETIIELYNTVICDMTPENNALLEITLINALLTDNTPLIRFVSNLLP